MTGSPHHPGVAVAVVAVTAALTVVTAFAMAGSQARPVADVGEGRSLSTVAPALEPERATSDDVTEPMATGDLDLYDTPTGFTSVVGEPLTESVDGAPTGPQQLGDEGVVPVRVRIPAIDLDSPLEDLGTADGVLLPPDVPESAGWYTEGTVPGNRGPAVIAGHVDSGVAGAVFRDLDELADGDAVEVEMSDGTVLTFRVDRTQVVSQQQAQFPTSAVYGPVPDAQLRLITCHTFDPDRARYVDNLVVFATLEGEDP